MGLHVRPERLEKQFQGIGGKVGGKTIGIQPAFFDVYSL